MKSLGSFIFAFILSSQTPVYENIAQEVNYEFVQNENKYSFTANLFLAADPDCLFDRINKFEYLQEYSLGAKSIQLVQENEKGYDVLFVYQKLLFIENESTWRRTFSPDKRKIVFEMLSSETNIGWIPKIISSTGYYQITPVDSGSFVAYYQRCDLDQGALQDIYMRKAKKEAIQFLEKFKEFLSNNCILNVPNLLHKQNNNP